MSLECAGAGDRVIMCASRAEPHDPADARLCTPRRGAIVLNLSTAGRQAAELS